MTMKRIEGGCVFAPWFCAPHAMPAFTAAREPACGYGVTTGVLEGLQKQGYDVSEIQAALARGDMATAGILMQQLKKSRPDMVRQPA